MSTIKNHFDFIMWFQKADFLLVEQHKLLDSTAYIIRDLQHNIPRRGH